MVRREITGQQHLPIGLPGKGMHLPVAPWPRLEGRIGRAVRVHTAHLAGPHLIVVVEAPTDQEPAVRLDHHGLHRSAERAVDGRYVRNSVVATFAGAFPMDRPRYVVLVMIDRPPGNAYSLGQRTAGFTAAPVVRRVVERIGPMLGIYPDASRDVDISDLEPLIWKPRGEQ